VDGDRNHVIAALELRFAEPDAHTTAVMVPFARRFTAAQSH